MNLELALLLAELVQKGSVTLKNQVGAIGVCVRVHVCAYVCVCLYMCKLAK